MPDTTTPRGEGHTLTLLANGQVLVTGGYNGSDYTASAELYDPASNTWSSAPSMSIGRYAPAATLLASGQVLVTGGFTNSGDTASAELYGSPVVVVDTHNPHTDATARTADAPIPTFTGAGTHAGPGSQP
ncbi:MAG: hypothetical protein LC744_05510 [Chloroflexi bacterium]|nr:hypothetical protein [Chloroflexota bacterium]